jgi:hypothetical protein
MGKIFSNHVFNLSDSRACTGCIALALLLSASLLGCGPSEAQRSYEKLQEDELKRSRDRRDYAEKALIDAYSGRAQNKVTVETE